MFIRLVPASAAAPRPARTSRRALLSSFAVAGTVTLLVIGAFAQLIPADAMTATKAEQVTPVVLPTVQVIAAR